MTKKNPGKQFEESFQTSSAKDGLFYDRIKDPPPTTVRSKNKFDYYLYLKPNLFALELKSTSSKSISLADNIIRPHQIENLTEAAKFDGVISGFVFNFRKYGNFTVFVHIDEFNKYKQKAKSESKDHTYVKLNGSSFPLEVAEQVGIKINNVIKKTNYHYYVRQFVEQAVEKYGHGTSK